MKENPSEYFRQRSKSKDFSPKNIPFKYKYDKDRKINAQNRIINNRREISSLISYTGRKFLDKGKFTRIDSKNSIDQILNFNVINEKKKDLTNIILGNNNNELNFRKKPSTAGGSGPKLKEGLQKGQNQLIYEKLLNKYNKQIINEKVMEKKNSASKHFINFNKEKKADIEIEPAVEKKKKESLINNPKIKISNDTIKNEEPIVINIKKINNKTKKKKSKKIPNPLNHNKFENNLANSKTETNLLKLENKNENLDNQVSNYQKPNFPNVNLFFPEKENPKKMNDNEMENESSKSNIDNIFRDEVNLKNVVKRVLEKNRKEAEQRSKEFFSNYTSHQMNLNMENMSKSQGRFFTKSGWSTINQTNKPESATLNYLELSIKDILQWRKHEELWNNLTSKDSLISNDLEKYLVPPNDSDVILSLYFKLQGGFQEKLVLDDSLQNPREEIQKWKNAYKRAILRWHPDKLFNFVDGLKLKDENKKVILKKKSACIINNMNRVLQNILKTLKKILIRRERN